MERKIGTVSRGVRCPIIREGDNLVDITVTSVLEAAQSEGYEMRDRDVVALTESIVARSQGNYASVRDIADDVKTKLGGETIGVIFPILSRNRFAICLKGIAMGAKKVVLMLSYPSDEVGNALLTYDQLDDANINPYSDVLTLEKYRELFGENKHEFTGVDYVQYYSDIITDAGAEVEIVFANQAKTILDYTDRIINCDIHTRKRTKRILLENGAKVVCGMDDILNASVNGSGYNSKYGLLGSNKSTEDTIKLFPNECFDLVENIQKQTRLHPRCGTSFLLIVMILSILVFALAESILSNYFVWMHAIRGYAFIRMGIKLLLLPLLVAISYEINRWVGRYDNWFTRILTAPGMWFQKFTTNEPDDSMVEVAITAVEAVLPEEEGADRW